MPQSSVKIYCVLKCNCTLTEKGKSKETNERFCENVLINLVQPHGSWGVNTGLVYLGRRFISKAWQADKSQDKEGICTWLELGSSHRVASRMCRVERSGFHMQKGHVRLVVAGAAALHITPPHPSQHSR